MLQVTIGRQRRIPRIDRMYNLRREQRTRINSNEWGYTHRIRTGRCRQQTDSTKIEGDKEDLGEDTNRNKDKELIQRLNAKIKELQNMIDEQSSAVKEFLKILTTVKKLQGNLAQISSEWQTPSNSKSQFRLRAKWSNPLNQRTILWMRLFTANHM